MKGSKESPDAGQLSKEKIATLPRWAMVALAARSAVRLAPAIRPGRNRTPVEAKADLLALDTCGTLTSLAAILAENIEAYIGRAAEEAASLARETMDREIAAVESAKAADAAVYAVRSASADSVAATAEAAWHAVFHSFVEDSSKYPPTGAANWDYQALHELELGAAGQDGRAVPSTFFDRPLWPTEIPILEMAKRQFDEWQKLLDKTSLLDLFERHMMMVYGKGVDWEEAKHRVETWATENVKRELKVTPGRPDLFALSDLPLEDDAGDLLGFKPFADALAGLVDHPKTNTPLCIAINAPWGSGKSSLASMIERRLRSWPHDRGDLPHITCWFNAWMHDDAPNLASACAAEVAQTANRFRPLWRRVINPLPIGMLAPADRRKRRILIGIVIVVLVASLSTVAVWLNPKLYSPNMEFYGLISRSFGATVGSLTVVLTVLTRVLSALAPAVKSLAGFVNDPQTVAASGSIRQVSEQLGRLIHQTTQGKRRFVIFVDDLERCKPPTSVAVLEAVNQLLSHKDVVTVIMAELPAIAASVEFKYEQLAKSYIPSIGLTLAESGKGGQAYGRAYLQKIIQFQFDLPVLHRDDLHRFVTELFEGRKNSAESEKTSTEPESNGRRKQPTGAGRSKTLWWVLPLSVSIVAVVTTFNMPVWPDAALPRLAVGLGIGLLSGVLTWVVIRLHESLIAYRKRKAREKIDAAIRKRVADGERDLEKLGAAVAASSLEPKDIGLTNEKFNELVHQRLQLYLTDESLPLLEAMTEFVKYVPPLPRNLKRGLDRLRVLIVIAHGRGMFRGHPTLTGTHLGKWVALRERWPEIAQELSKRPETMEELESVAFDEARFSDLVGLFAPNHTSDKDFHRFCQSETRLGQLMNKLVYFQGANESVSEPSQKPSV